jgi:hypothetical protein
MDITPITAVVGAITGCASLLWNILTYIGFNLEIYSSYLSFEHDDAIFRKEILKYTGATKNTDKYSDDAMILRGWFKLLLRKEGQRFKNHHVDSLSIELGEELRDTLANILAEPPSYIPLFPSGETKELRLFEGAPIEVKVHSNSLFLKKDWKNLTNLRLDELTKKLNDFIEKDENKIYVQLTTYKFPLAYEKKGDWFHREYLWKRTVNSIRWHLKI